METSFIKKPFNIIQNKALKIALPLALDVPIAEKAFLENEINMPFEKIKSDADAVLYCFQQMDWQMLDDLLDEDIQYEDKSKDMFIAELRQHFYKFQLAGDTYLHCFKGKCNGRNCSNKKTTLGFEFFGNKSKRKYKLIMDFANGKVQDLFECSSLFDNISL
jgi:hypothetical protein